MRHLSLSLALTALSACELLAPSDSRPPPSVVIDGLEFGLTVDPAFSDRTNPRLILAVRNTTGERVVRELASGCMLWPRAYLPGQWERPAWNSEQVMDCALIGPVTVDLAPGETFTTEWWHFDAHPLLILADSLPGGAYALGARIRPRADALAVDPRFAYVLVAAGDAILPQ